MRRVVKVIKIFSKYYGVWDNGYLETLKGQPINHRGQGTAFGGGVEQKTAQLKETG